MLFSPDIKMGNIQISQQLLLREPSEHLHSQFPHYRDLWFVITHVVLGWDVLESVFIKPAHPL